MLADFHPAMLFSDININPVIIKPYPQILMDNKIYEYVFGYDVGIVKKTAFNQKDSQQKTALRAGNITFYFPNLIQTFKQISELEQSIKTFGPGCITDKTPGFLQKLVRITTFTF